jgi:ankyrin repeat protein
MKELFEAVRAGDVSRVKALVEADPGLAIYAACIMGETEKVEEMIAGNRSIATKLSDDGWTPLHLAAFFGHVDTARALLNKGAVVDARSTNAMQNTPLHAAAAGKHSGMVQLLVDHGASVNARQHGGWAPIHAAAQSGDLATAEILATAGADLAARAENNQCPLDLALTKGQQKMVEFLEAHGAKL